MSRFFQPQPSEQSGASLLEAYALQPEKRSELVQAIPMGSADHYLYQLRLISQDLQDPTKEITTERIDKATEYLNSASIDPVCRDRRQEIEQFANQFALLGYKVQPNLLLKQISFNKSSVTQLDYSSRTALETATAATEAASAQFGGQQLQQTEEKKRLGDIRDHLTSTLDQDMVKTDVLVKRLLEDLKRIGTFDTRVVQGAWPFVLAHPDAEAVLLNLHPDALLTLFKTTPLSISPKSLEMIGETDSSQADTLVVKMILRLVEVKKLDFDSNSRGQFQQLTSAQLKSLQTANPALIHNEGFVGLLEKRILPRPSMDHEVKESAEVHGEWLDRMLTFVDQLSPKFNRHRLSVYLMSLEFDLNKGIMNKDKFMR